MSKESQLHTVTTLYDARRVVVQMGNGRVLVTLAPGSTMPEVGQSILVIPTPDGNYLGMLPELLEVQDEGTPLRHRGKINFIGATVTAADNPVTHAIDITISAALHAELVYNLIALDPDVGLVVGDEIELPPLAFAGSITEAWVLAPPGSSSTISCDLRRATYTARNTFSVVNPTSIDVSASDKARYTGWAVAVSIEDILCVRVTAVTGVVERIMVGFDLVRTPL